MRSSLPRVLSKLHFKFLKFHILSASSVFLVKGVLCDFTYSILNLVPLNLFFLDQPTILRFVLRGQAFLSSKSDTSGLPTLSLASYRASFPALSPCSNSDDLNPFPLDSLVQCQLSNTLSTLVLNHFDPSSNAVSLSQGEPLTPSTSLLVTQSPRQPAWEDQNVQLQTTGKTCIADGYYSV